MKTPAAAQLAKQLHDAQVVIDIAKLFAAVDAIDAHIGTKPLPTRGVIACPNCIVGRLTYLQVTRIKGAGRCSTPNCVDFASLYL